MLYWLWWQLHSRVSISIAPCPYLYCFWSIVDSLWWLAGCLHWHKQTPRLHCIPWIPEVDQLAHFPQNRCFFHPFILNFTLTARGQSAIHQLLPFAHLFACIRFLQFFMLPGQPYLKLCISGIAMLVSALIQSHPLLCNYSTFHNSYTMTACTVNPEDSTKRKCWEGFVCGCNCRLIHRNGKSRCQW